MTRRTRTRLGPESASTRSGIRMLAELVASTRSPLAGRVKFKGPLVLPTARIIHERLDIFDMRVVNRRPAVMITFPPDFATTRHDYAHIRIHHGWHCKGG